VEDQVIARYQMRAKDAGISDVAAAEIAQILMRESIEAQARLPRPMKMSKEVLVIGGSGKMGLWFARYLAMHGHKVRVHDLVDCKEFPMVKDLKAAVRTADVTILAVPIREAEMTLQQVISARPKGLVFDIMSVKAPIVPSLRQAAESGIMICSVHPMFGPDALSMYSRNIIVCDCGSQMGVDEFLPLVEGMGANLTQMPVEEHDELISYVLGLSHAINIAFFDALNRSSIGFKRIDDIASTTFRRQSATSRSVARESPGLYYEIQHDNPYTDRCLELLVKAVEELRQAALSPNDEAFVKIMKDGRKYFGED
jgi:chorismate mutase/prephenate dehydrogenase